MTVTHSGRSSTEFQKEMDAPDILDCQHEDWDGNCPDDCKGAIYCDNGCGTILDCQHEDMGDAPSVMQENGTLFCNKCDDDSKIDYNNIRTVELMDFFDLESESYVVSGWSKKPHENILRFSFDSKSEAINKAIEILNKMRGEK